MIKVDVIFLMPCLITRAGTPGDGSIDDTAKHDIDGAPRHYFATHSSTTAYVYIAPSHVVDVYRNFKESGTAFDDDEAASVLCAPPIRAAA